MPERTAKTATAKRSTAKKPATGKAAKVAKKTAKSAKTARSTKTSRPVKTAARAKPAKTTKSAKTTKTGRTGKAAKPGRASRAAASKPSPRRLAVREDESPWTAAELADVRRELEADAERLRSELAITESEIADLLRDGSDGAGNDQADVGSNTLERDHEMSLANNWRDMLQQVEHALQRIDDGSYGTCERCGNPIGKMRLMAFPRATLCLSCKQREERR